MWCLLAGRALITEILGNCLKKSLTLFTSNVLMV